DGAGRRTGLEAAGIGAVHAAVLADEPFEILGLRVHPLREAHHREARRGEIERIVIDAVVEADLLAQVIPLKARHLAGLATDAFRYVDELCHRRELTRRYWHIRRRAAHEILVGELCRRVLQVRIGKWGKHGHHLPYATGPGMGSISTKNALYSGVSILASPTKGVSEFGPKPFLAAPVKPQCSGMPTMCTGLPSQLMGKMRLVTTAFAFTDPR